MQNTNLISGQKRLTLLSAANYLNKTESAASHAKSLAEKASIDSLFSLAINMRLCCTWVSEIKQIEDALIEAMDLDCENSRFGFERDLDFLINLAESLDSQIGIERMKSVLHQIEGKAKALERIVNIAIVY